MIITRAVRPALLALTGVVLALTGCTSPADGKPAPTTTTIAEDGLGSDPVAGAPATLSVLDPTHDRPFEVALWAPGGTDRHHLVALSHGFAGDATSHAPLADALATLGYTVIAPTHPDLAGLESGQADLDPLTLRPLHLSLAVDHLEEADGPFESVTVVGHSLGGYAALLMLGAHPSGDGVAEHCRHNPEDDVMCGAALEPRFAQLLAGPAVVADPRIDRAVLLAPAYGPLFSADDLAATDSPILVVEADSDEALPGDQVQELVENLPYTPEIETVPGGHFVFLRDCTTEESDSLPELCIEPGAVDRLATAATLVTTIDEFITQN